MSDEYKTLDNKTKFTLESVRDELRREYQNKILELEKRAAFGDKVLARDAFYAPCEAQTFKGFKLDNYTLLDKLDKSDFASLQQAFLQKFGSYYLFIQGNISLSERDYYQLWVIKGNSVYTSDDDKIPACDYDAMRNFVQGFLEARKLNKHIK